MKKKSLFILLFATGVLIYTFIASSFAENPCKKDISEYCSAVQEGSGRIIACLKDHYKEISQECYDFISKHDNDKSSGGKTGNPMADSCKPDVAKYCSDIKPGEGRIVACLKDHYKDLSQECYDALSKSKSK